MTHPIRHRDRLAFEAGVRRCVDQYDPYEESHVRAICHAAHLVQARHPWATDADTANALVDILGTGWAAQYLHWAHEGRWAA